MYDILSLPEEVLFVILDFVIKYDSHYVMVKNISRHGRYIAREWKKTKVVYSPRLRYEGVWLGSGLNIRYFVESMELLQWAIKYGRYRIRPESSGILNAAVIVGNFEVIKWLRSQGCVWDSQTCNYATQKDKINIFKWLRQQGCPWDEWTCRHLVVKGNLEGLKWAKREGIPPCPEICGEAAVYGRLGILKWLKTQGFQMDETVSRWAVDGGHIKILKWLRSQNCPGWNVRTPGIHYKTHRWLTARGVPGEWSE